MKENENAVSAVDAEPKKPTSKKAERINEEEPRIYIGPSFKGMISGTVLKNGVPAGLQEVIRLCPVVGELVVPVRNLVKAKKELGKPDSAMRRFFHQAEIFCLKDKKGGINSGR